MASPARTSVQTRCIPDGSNSFHVAATPPEILLLLTTESTIARPKLSRCDSGENAASASRWYTRASAMFAGLR